MTDREPEIPGQMPSSFDDAQDFYNERPMQKVTRKLKEEPLVPLGIGLTVFAFVNAYRAIRRGDSHQANRMFRARVLAQGFTVVAMVAGSMYYSKDREKTKELRELKSQQDAEEKRQKWIRELEARDQEEQAMKKLVQQKVASRSAAAAEEKSSAPPAEETAGTGGILGRMGLWPRADKAADEGEKAKEDVEETVAKSTKSRRENPKSSLGAIGELMSSQKKGGKGDGSGEEPKK